MAGQIQIGQIGHMNILFSAGNLRKEFLILPMKTQDLRRKYLGKAVAITAISLLLKFLKSLKKILKKG